MHELSHIRSSGGSLCCSPVRRSSYVLILLLVGCNANTTPVGENADIKPATAQFMAQAGHSPPFARMSFAGFGRAEAVAIAQQEWRLFGEHVDDNPPSPGGFEPAPGDDPERAPGHWERIGEYWWLGQDMDSRQSAWTGMHDENGNEIDASRDDYYAWSAAFISYVMRTAGAGARFPYAPSHYAYINIAKEMTLGRTSGWAVMAETVNGYAPAPGDLICYSRERYKLTYEKLPRRRFIAHCDIVVALDPGKAQISVIGGNVDHTVTMKHVPVSTDGRLADANGQVLDTRYPWLVVIRVLYDR
jgi:hypothetical protein